jgi:hypothetical protein
MDTYDFVFDLPSDVTDIIGELFFVLRRSSACSSMWCSCIVVGPDSLPMKHMVTICKNFYSNVS